MSHYALTKTAMLSLTKSLANELGAYNITVNSITPGVILTPSWDDAAKEAPMQPEEYAKQFCKSV